MTGSNSAIFGPVARGLFFVLQVFSVYLLLRGHNLPGGGFSGGLVSAIAFVMLGLALGWNEVRGVMRADPARLAFWGLLLAGLTGMAPLVLGRRFFEQFLWHVPVPFLGEVHVGTPLAFDAGVFLVVVGIAVKMILVLGRSTSGMEVFSKVEEQAYASVVEEPIEGWLGESSVTRVERTTFPPTGGVPPGGRPGSTAGGTPASTEGGHAG